MESESKMDTPKSEQEIWSPDVLFGSFPNRSGTGMTSTPCWPMSFTKCDGSAGSSKQDSGYCSITPTSANSDRVLFGTCRICQKSLNHSYTQSTPDYMCRCDKPGNDGSSNLECMEAVQEVRTSPTPKLATRIRLNRPLELFEDAMDTSLYNEEMEVDHHSPGENHQCSLYFSDLGEEKSIDFMESQGSSTTLNASKESQPICLPIRIPTNFVNIKDSQGSGKVDCKILEVSSEGLFSPEIFDCDLVSPKIKNELTPTKVKRGTPTLKVKKGSSFQSSAKQVATMNRVLRSFFPLNGIESVDFLYQLGVKKDFKIIIEKIFSFLNEEDLDAVRVVSKTWNKLLYNDHTALKRWELYRATTKLRKENMMSPVRHGGSGGRDRPALTRLQNVTNLTSPPRQSFSPPVSPGSARFRSYQKAIKSLKKDERLLACPMCRFPSKDYGNPVAQCNRSGCRYRFCVWCSNEVLPERQHNCPPDFIPRCLPRRNSMHTIGSKSSKRYLRRLL